MYLIFGCWAAGRILIYPKPLIATNLMIVHGKAFLWAMPVIINGRYTIHTLGKFISLKMCDLTRTTPTMIKITMLLWISMNTIMSLK